jgi:hypothetical protein
MMAKPPWSAGIDERFAVRAQTAPGLGTAVEISEGVERPSWWDRKQSVKNSKTFLAW